MRLSSTNSNNDNNNNQLFSTQKLLCGRELARVCSACVCYWPSHNGIMHVNSLENTSITPHQSPHTLAWPPRWATSESVRREPKAPHWSQHLCAIATHLSKSDVLGGTRPSFPSTGAAIYLVRNR